MLPLKIYSPRTKSLELFTCLVVDYKIFIDKCRDLLPCWQLASYNAHKYRLKYNIFVDNSIVDRVPWQNLASPTQ